MKDDAKLQSRFDSLASSPGIGAVTAMALLIEMPELGTLENGGRQPRWLGHHHPRERSMERRELHRGRRAALRQALCMPTLVMIRFNPDLKAKYQALTAAGKPAKLAVVAIMRKLIILANAPLGTGRTWDEKLLDQDGYSRS